MVSNKYCRGFPPDYGHSKISILPFISTKMSILTLYKNIIFLTYIVTLFISENLCGSQCGIYLCKSLILSIVQLKIFSVFHYYKNVSMWEHSCCFQSLVLSPDCFIICDVFFQRVEWKDIAGVILIIKTNFTTTETMKISLWNIMLLRLYNRLFTQKYTYHILLLLWW